VLTNRELATLILLGVALVVLFVVPGLRRSVGPSMLGVLRAFFVPRILAVFLAMFAWIAGCLALGWLVGGWDWDLLKDAIVITVTLAIPMLFRVIGAKSGGVIARDLVREALGIAALLEFYLNVEPFPLWAELLIQPFATLLVALNAVAATKDEWRAVRRLTGGMLTVVGLAAIAWTTVSIVHDASRLDWLELLRSFLLTLWLPALLLPFLYLVSFFATVEVVIVRVAWLRNQTRRLPFRVGLAILLGFRFRVSLAAAFSGRYNGIARAATYREARDYLRHFREDVRTGAAA